MLGWQVLVFSICSASIRLICVHMLSADVCAAWHGVVWRMLLMISVRHGVAWLRLLIMNVWHGRAGRTLLISEFT